jgi:hypothetical protein
MIANRMRLTTDALQGEIFTFPASATRALTTMIRNLRRSRWFLLFVIAGGALVSVVAVKLLALLGAAFGVSFLRDVGNNVGSGAAAGGAGAGLGGGAAGSGGDGGQGDDPIPDPPDRPDPFWSPLLGPFAPGQDPNKTPLHNAFDVGFWSGIYFMTANPDPGPWDFPPDWSQVPGTAGAAGLGRWTDACGGGAGTPPCDPASFH